MLQQEPVKDIGLLLGAQRWSGREGHCRADPKQCL